MDGRVSIANLNGTMRARSDGSVRVLVLRPGGGGQNNPAVCRYDNNGGHCVTWHDMI